MDLDFVNQGQQKQQHEMIDVIGDLQMKVDDLEQYGRRMDLRFSGIPNATDEDTDKLVLKTINETIGLVLNITDIQRSNCSGRPSNISPKQILARFASYRIAAQVCIAKRRLKDMNLYVSEDLTKWRNNIFFQARRPKKTQQIEDS